MDITLLIKSLAALSGALGILVFLFLFFTCKKTAQEKHCQKANAYKGSQA
ncbi:hypothetical protein [Sulfurimonas sp. NW9]